MIKLISAIDSRHAARVRVKSYQADLSRHLRTFHDERLDTAERVLARALADLVIESEDHAKMRSAILV